MKYESYYETFSRKYRKCKSKKDYKKLCREMINLYGVIDQVDENQWKIFSSVLGEEKYVEGLALAIKMYILEQQGISCDIVSSCSICLSKSLKNCFLFNNLIYIY